MGIDGGWELLELSTNLDTYPAVKHLGTSLDFCLADTQMKGEGPCTRRRDL